MREKQILERLTLHQRITLERFDIEFLLHQYTESLIGKIDRLNKRLKAQNEILKNAIMFDVASRGCIVLDSV